MIGSLSLRTSKSSRLTSKRAWEVCGFNTFPKQLRLKRHKTSQLLIFKMNLTKSGMICSVTNQCQKRVTAYKASISGSSLSASCSKCQAKDLKIWLAQFSNPTWRINMKLRHSWEENKRHKIRWILQPANQSKLALLLASMKTWNSSSSVKWPCTGSPPANPLDKPMKSWINRPSSHFCTPSIT